jgi:hypothetical protein
MYDDMKVFVWRCGACQRHGNINSRDAMPLTTNLQIELFDVWGIDYMGPFPKSGNYEYILVAVDYVSKWVEAMPCRVADSKNSNKMFHEIIFPRFGVLRMVISDGGSHFIDRTLQRYLSSFGIRHNIATPYHPHKVARQRHLISKLRIFFRKRSMKWEQDGRIGYPRHCGHIGWPTKHLLGCHPTNLSMGRPVTCLLS